MSYGYREDVQSCSIDCKASVDYGLSFQREALTSSIHACSTLYNRTDITDQEDATDADGNAETITELTSALATPCERRAAWLVRAVTSQHVHRTCDTTVQYQSRLQAGPVVSSCDVMCDCHKAADIVSSRIAE